MPKAIWNHQVIADSDHVEVVEGNLYFPASSVNPAYLAESTTTTHCSWKGQAHYYSLTVDGQTNPDAAWYYPDPKPEAAQIKGHLAFWKGVEVIR